jgi:polyhydroxybutyrate depolymerase
MQRRRERRRVPTRGAPLRERRPWWGVALAVVVLQAGAACADDQPQERAAAPTSTTTTAPAYPDSVPARPSPGCDSSAAAELDRERRTIDVGGIERWYLLSVPPGHDTTTPLPLVVELHGLAEGAEIAAKMSEIDTLGDREGFVSVFPNGSGVPVRWDERIDSTANADLDFLDALLDELEASLCIDEARVYATGLSYGAIMSSALACARADRFAAIAPVDGVQYPPTCAPGRPVPVLAFHGTADPILLFNGGVGDLGAALSGRAPPPPDRPVDLHGDGYPATVDAWAEANGCGTDVDERPSPHVIERIYDCDRDSEVRFFIVEGGGHSWPGSELSMSLASVVGPTTDELDATTEIWRFFERHALEASS